MKETFNSEKFNCRTDDWLVYVWTWRDTLVCSKATIIHHEATLQKRTTSHSSFEYKEEATIETNIWKVSFWSVLTAILLQLFSVAERLKM